MGNLLAQSYSAYTSYAWDEWNKTCWTPIYSNGWYYAAPMGGNARDFYFRFQIRDSWKLRELTKKEWKEFEKKDNGWKTEKCTFEYYISDDFPTLEKALKTHSWPCAKYYVASRKPTVLKSAEATVKIKFDSRDEVTCLNFWIDGYGFALTVYWDLWDDYTIHPKY